MSLTCVADTCRFPPKTLSDPSTEMYLSCLLGQLHCLLFPSFGRMEERKNRRTHSIPLVFPDSSSAESSHSLTSTYPVPSPISYDTFVADCDLL
jgi:hypothetical protein